MGNLADSIIGTFLPKVYIQRVILESSAGKFLPKSDNPHIMEHPLEHNRIQSEDGGIKSTVFLTVKDTISNDLFGTWFSNQNILNMLNVEVYQSKDKVVTNFLIDKNIVKGNLETVNILEGNQVDVIKEEFTRLLESGIENGTVVKQNFTLEEFVEREEGGTILLSKHPKTGPNGEIIYDFTLKVEFATHDDSDPEHLSFFARTFINPDFIAEVLINPPLEQFVGETVVETVINNFELVSQRIQFNDAETLQKWEGTVHQRKDGTWRTGSNQTAPARLLNRVVIPNSSVQDFRTFPRIRRINIDLSSLENRLHNTQNQVKLLTNDLIDVRRIPNYVTNTFMSRGRRGAYNLFLGINVKKIAEEQTLFGNFFKNDLVGLMDSIQISSLQIWRKRINNPVSRQSLGEEAYENWDDNESDHLVVITAGDENNSIIQAANRTGNGIEQTLQGTIKPVELLLSNSNIKHIRVTDHVFFDNTDGFFQYGIKMIVSDNTAKVVVQKLSELNEALSILGAYYNESIKVGIKRATLIDLNPHISHPSQRLASEVEIMRDNYDPFANRFTKNFAIWANESNPTVPQSKLQEVLVALDKVIEIISMFKNAQKVSESSRELLEEQRRELLEEQRTLDLQYVSEFFQSLVDPESGNPAGIAEIIRIAQTLQERLQQSLNMAGSSEPKSDQLLGSVPPPKLSKAGNAGLRRKIEITKWFPAIVDSDISSKTGYDYHSISQLDSIIHRRDRSRVEISLDDYKERVRRESLKYYIPEGEEDILSKSLTLNGADGENLLSRNSRVSDSAYGYLTPSAVYIDGSPVFTGLKRPTVTINNTDSYGLLLGKVMTCAKDVDREGNSRCSSPLTGFQPNTNLTINYEISINEQALGFMLKKIIGNEDMIVVDNTTEGTALSEQGVEESLLINRVDELMNVGNVVESENVERILNDFRNSRMGVGESTRPNNLFLKIINKANDSVVNFDLNNELNILESAENLQQQKVDSLPNQIKALLERSANIRKPWHLEPFDSMKNSKNLGTLMFNYKLLKQVEVLVGYEVAVDGTEQTKEPIFEILSREKIQRFEADENLENLLCRIVPYKNDDFPYLNSFVKTKDVELSIYEQYFVISKTERSTPLEGEA